MHNNNFQNLVKINENFKKINKNKITNNNISSQNAIEIKLRKLLLIILITFYISIK